MAKHAIVIGIGPSVLDVPLMSAAEDARRMATLLEGQNAHAGLQPHEQWAVYPVIAKNAADTYTGSKHHVDREFRAWAEWAKTRSDQDRTHLLIYFAGHAEKRGNGEVALLATDGAWITLRDLAQDVSALKARNITVILDCCYAGELAKEFGRLTEAAGGSRDGRAVFAACSEDGEALGYRDKSGAFTNLILKGLGADPSVPAGPVTARSLEDYLYENWLSLPEEVTSRQQLVAHASLPIGGDDIPLVRIVRPSEPRRNEDTDGRPEAATSVDGPLGSVRARRTSGGVELYGIARGTGELHPWRVQVSLAPSEQLLAVTLSFDGSTAWLAVSDGGGAHVVRVRERDGVQRYAVEGVSGAVRARFGGDGDGGRDTVVFETAGGVEHPVPVRTLRPVSTETPG